MALDADDGVVLDGDAESAPVRHVWKRATTGDVHSRELRQQLHQRPIVLGEVAGTEVVFTWTVLRVSENSKHPFQRAEDFDGRAALRAGGVRPVHLARLGGPDVARAETFPANLHRAL